MYFEETYQTEEILAVRLDDSQLVTLQLESVNFIRFQPDKGAHIRAYCPYAVRRIKD